MRCHRAQLYMLRTRQRDGDLVIQFDEITKTSVLWTNCNFSDGNFSDGNFSDCEKSGKIKILL